MASVIPVVISRLLSPGIYIFFGKTGTSFIALPLLSKFHHFSTFKEYLPASLLKVTCFFSLGTYFCFAQLPLDSFSVPCNVCSLYFLLFILATITSLISCFVNPFGNPTG